MTDTDKIKLEAMIDENTLSDVLYELSIICFEKAEHIESTYGNGDAEVWDHAGDDIDELAESIEV